MRDVIYGRPMNRFWIDFHQLKIDCTVIAVNPSCGGDAEVNARVLLVRLQSIHLSSQVLNLLLQFRHLFEKFSRKKNRIFNIRHQTFAELCSNTCYRFWFNQTIILYGCISSFAFKPNTIVTLKTQLTKPSWISQNAMSLSREVQANYCPNRSHWMCKIFVDL